ISSNNLCSISDVMRYVLLVSNNTFASVSKSKALMMSSCTLNCSSGSLMKDLVIFGKEGGVTSASVRKLMVSNNLLPEMGEPASNKILSAFSYRLTNLTGG